jgi:hypothetical protein
MELRLRLSREFRGADNLDCRRTSRRWKAVRGVRADEKLTAFVKLESAIQRAIATTIG